MAYVERMVELSNGVALETTIISPKDGLNVEGALGRMDGLAVLCHPWSWLGGRMHDPVLDQLVRPVLNHHYRVVLFNSRGVGKSTKWPSFTALSEAEDLQLLVKELALEMAKEPSSTTQLKRVVLLGYSHGSIPASHHPTQINVQDLSIPVYHILLSYPLSPMPLLTAFSHNRHASALQALTSSPSARVLIAYGDQDQFTGVSKFDSWSQKLLKAQGTVIVQKVEGADHFWHGRPMSELKRYLDVWLESLNDSNQGNA